MSMKPVYIVEPVRTPVGKYGGALRSIRPDDLAAGLLRELVSRTQLDASLIDDIKIGRAHV